ncbi:MAG TPA: MAE_28990/MAE_18760 family HEPN-like nuclease [Chitinophagales bacterium]|nr:MAE_28990/MAE_18760 family HEPN-like nuclease [Chitinophagales bacterium]
MGSLRIDSQEQRLEALFAEVKKIDEGDELKSHLSKYLCLQVSGYLENVLRDLITEYAKGKCPQAIANYVNYNIEYCTNLKDERLYEILGSFDTTWADTFRTSLTQEQKASLNSIIANRNQIAHGNYFNSNISYRSISDYYSDLKEIVRVLRTIIKKK